MNFIGFASGYEKSHHFLKWLFCLNYSCWLVFPDVSINVSAKDNREIINAIRKVSPPAHLPTYKKVPKKKNAAIVMLGVSFCIWFRLDLNCCLSGQAQRMISSI